MSRVPAVNGDSPTAVSLAKARTALAAARDDWDRVAVRDYALKLAKAYEIVGNKALATEASLLVSDAERIIAQHNPAKPPEGRNPHGAAGNNMLPAGNIFESPLDRHTMSKLRSVHQNLTDAEYEAAKAEAVESSEPLTRAGLKRRVNAKRREAQQQQRREESSVEALPEGKFAVILADPPWQYENAPVGDPRRSAEAHYDTMSLDEICGLPVDDIAADDSALFLWATNPMLPEALQVMDAWGFRYRTNAVWVKNRMGTGYWFRGQHELLLLGVRGRFPTPLKTMVPSSVLQAPRQKHSQKPVEVAEMLERIFPEAAKLEMFCRSPRPGWAVWGNESAAA